MSNDKELYWLQRKNAKCDWITMTDGGGNLYRFISVEAALYHKKFWHDAPETPDTFRVVIVGTSEVVG